jgi:hypothetical protein
MEDMMTEEERELLREIAERANVDPNGFTVNYLRGLAEDDEEDEEEK